LFICTVYVCLGFVALTDGDNYDSVQRAISQVIHQLRHLVSVWKNVLPAHIYAKSLGQWRWQWSVA